MVPLNGRRRPVGNRTAAGSGLALPGLGGGGNPAVEWGDSLAQSVITIWVFDFP